jgi:hypothetical protein
VNSKIDSNHAINNKHKVKRMKDAEGHNDALIRKSLERRLKKKMLDRWEKRGAGAWPLSTTSAGCTQTPYWRR